MTPIRTLVDRAAPHPIPTLPATLHKQYGGDLYFPLRADRRPYVVGNFVSSLDGIVSYRIPGKAGGGEISGNNEPDRFIMGLLRASADAIVIGAGTLQATSPSHVWTPEAVYPEAASPYREYRTVVLQKPAPASTVIVSASGVLDLNRPMFRRPSPPIRILTTAKGGDRLRDAGVDSLPAAEVIVLGDSGGTVSLTAILHFLHADCGVRLLLHEGGPTLFGQFVAAGLIDEFFLTVAPQIVGSSTARPRPTMVWGSDFLPETAPWVRLLSVKQSGEHLFSPICAI
jgi:riboflavin biosynthesis pyrimidine reductase